MTRSTTIPDGVWPLLALALAIALLIAAPRVLGVPAARAQTAGTTTTTTTYPPCQVGLQLSACSTGTVTTVNGSEPWVTVSTVGTAACPGGYSVVLPNLPCPSHGTQTCADGSVMPVTQVCPQVFGSCPDGEQASANAPCPNVSPDSCPHGGFGPMPRDCTGIGGG